MTPCGPSPVGCSTSATQATCAPPARCTPPASRPWSNSPTTTLPRDFVRLRFPLSDDGLNPDWLLTLAVDSVAALVRAGVPTLVACSAGMSRSLCVATAGLVQAEGRPLTEVLAELVGGGPADVSPGLWAHVRRRTG